MSKKVETAMQSYIFRTVKGIVKREVSADTIAIRVDSAKEQQHMERAFQLPNKIDRLAQNV